MRRDKFAALRAQIDTLRHAAGFVELRRPDGTVGRYTVGHFCGVLDYARKGATDDPTVEALIADLGVATNVAELDVFLQTVSSMVWEYGEDDRAIKRRGAIPDLSESEYDGGVPPSDPYADTAGAWEAELEAKRAENERIRNAPLNELTTAERLKRFARNRR
jgi:hypothetical protein